MRGDGSEMAEGAAELLSVEDSRDAVVVINKAGIIQVGDCFPLFTFCFGMVGSMALKLGPSSRPPQVANMRLHALFGYKGDALLGLNVSVLIPQPHAAVHNDYLRRHATTGASHIVGRTTRVDARHRAGYHFPALLTVTRVRPASVPQLCP